MYKIILATALLVVSLTANSIGDRSFGQSSYNAQATRAGVEARNNAKRLDAIEARITTLENAR